MSFQIRFTDLTPEQKEREDRAYEAVELLRKNGYAAEWVKTFTTERDKHPGYILVD